MNAPVLLFAIVSGLSLGPVRAGVGDWYVDVNDPSCPTGTGSRARPFCWIYQAVGAAADGDTIHIAPGTYPEFLVLDKDLALAGTGGAAVTIVNTYGQARVTHVLPGTTVEIRGLTLTNGYLDDGPGAGLLVDSGATVMLSCSTVSQNRTRTYRDDPDGGGIRNNGTLIVSDSLITGNTAEDIGWGGQGGGIFNAGSLTMTNTTVSGNFAVGYDSARGGGVGNGSGATLDLTLCTIRGNLASSYYDAFGGGIGGAGTLVLNRCSIVDNAVSGTYGFARGGGINGSGSPSTTLTSCTVAGNLTMTSSGTSRGGGIRPGSMTVLDHTVIAGNGAQTGPDCDGTLTSAGHILIGDTSDCTVLGDPTGNLYDVDPQFADPVAGDFSLQPTSPCIDAGDPALLATGQDLGNRPRLLDGDLDRVMVLDMGAFEFDHVTLTVTGDPTPGGMLTVDLKGTPGVPMNSWLWFGTASGELSYPPFGTLFLDLSSFWFLFRLGPLPASVSGTIPPNTPPGVDLVLQGLGIQPGAGGNLSNVIVVTID